MPRPRKRRRVGFLPKVTYFQPVGADEQFREELISVDEIEALRLKDVEGMDQENCAEHMGVAQSTFQRILTSARKKLSTAILEGKAIRIEGGDYKLAPYKLECDYCGHDWMKTSWSSPDDTIECPRCGKGKGWHGRYND
ncbi:DUF134 domain-containing protein [Desulfoscipio sp. XC116]|uniref:DUF134 domain-containing protein n=1 Tax=Desulfoscipio sp. XC116 TaxID=3144975 RepID=UPI00325ABD2D